MPGHSSAVVEDDGLLEAKPIQTFENALIEMSSHMSMEMSMHVSSMLSTHKRKQARSLQKVSMSRHMAAHNQGQTFWPILRGCPCCLLEDWI